MSQAIALQGFSLSPQQKRLWQLQPAVSGSAYRVEAVIEIQGPLQIDRLRKALEQVVARHEILRTTFSTLPGMTLPLQVIGDRVQVDLQVKSADTLEPCSEQAQEQEASFHVTCIQHTSDQHQLHLSLPALQMDAASLRQFVMELAQSYAGATCKEDPFQYADIATWQNDLLEEPDSAMVEDLAAVSARSYWQQLNLDALTVPLPLAKSRSALANSNFQPQIQSISLNVEVLTALQAQAELYQVSLSTLLLTSWIVFLQRLTQAENLVVGVATDGRHYEELATALGPLAKILPVTVTLNGEIPFSTLISQVQAQVQAALNWQDAFDWKVLKLPAFQSENIAYCPFSFAFTAGEAAVTAGDLSFKLQRLATFSDRFSVQLTCRVTATSLDLDFYYNSTEYSGTVITQLAGYFQTLLQGVVEQPDSAINRLPLLTAGDRQGLLTLHQTTVAYPLDQGIYQLFEAQVQQTPGAVAVVSEQGSLTYAELNARANQLAHYLQQQGVGPEVIVGLCLERSPALIIGLLAILKAGGAFLPLDPDWPDQRLSRLAQSAQSALVVTQQSFVPRWSDRPILVLDQAMAHWSEMPESNLEPTITSSCLAYVMYTSGSTGQPKGVAVEHRQLLNYVCGISERLNLPPGASFGLASTIAADLGYTIGFSALCTGGCLHLITQERATDPVAFADYCRRTPLDVLKLTPSHLAALLTSEHAAALLPRQRLILGGEALPWRLIQQVRGLGAACQIWNHYGPTEATIGVLTAPVPDLADMSTATVSLGQPLPNTQVYLLDEQQQPIPLGVAGEIYIGGAGVARGYLHQPALTQERFIANPFVAEISNSNSIGTRLYRTGDCARYLPDGSLEFLGRQDDQVKIRGFRIEPGEIEAILQQQPEVAQAVVVARSDANGQAQLVGYIVTRPSTEPSLTTLQRALQAQLPAYMVPALVRLKTLPLLPNGKVDRQALPDPETVHSNTPAYVPPSTPVEVALAEIWAKLLNLSQVGIHDKFFALGGDSILSIQMIARAHQIGVRLTPKQIYQHQTIAELATVADTTSTVQTEQGTVMGPVPLTPIQNWFFEQATCDPHYWNQSLLLEPQELLDPHVLQQAVQYLLQHHDALRSRFQPAEQGWQQMIHALDSEIPVEAVDLTALPLAEQWQALEAKATQLQGSLDLTTGPLLRVGLFQLNRDGAAVQRLLIVIHHLVVDGVSWRILLEDLQTAYQHLIQGQAVQLPAKTTSVQQWSQYLQEYVHSDAAQQGLHWQEGLRNPPDTLPVDTTAQFITTASLQTIELALSPAETKALLHELPQTARAQVQEILLTALVQTLTQWASRSSICLDLEGHGREDLFETVDLSRTVGWFTSLFPVQLNLTPGLTPAAALQSIRTQLRQIPQGGIGYGLWRYLSADPSAQNYPTSPVRFNYLGQADASFTPSSFRWATEPCGPSRSDRHCTPYLLDISGLVQAERLQLTWTYSDRLYQKTTIQHLVQQFEQNLRSLLTCGQTPEPYTLNDFPLANVHQTDLNKLLLKLNQAGGEKLT
ncbi:Polyketide synthase modules and related proteins [uncultured Synechococcales cyanobacterium]|uniref:Polyketide synthase modules and related proteins n=1 Tax=uncultured Synechococcales cyanobacterium TaxID=1936017 RepID=A0A6J4VSY2_9CYAN|nr:Polyketide synthase modules and related proteins [uncultured Synechococcales cyanobacterium]